MKSGKRSTALRLIYGAFDDMAAKTEKDPIELFESAISQAKPHLEVKSRRVGGATYQVPIEVSGDRQVSLALRWIVQYAKARKGVSMRRALAQELMDAAEGHGSAVKKRDDTHKMAQANKAFAHYRW
jgi:small subunit ribosomal protein S7